MKLRDTIEVFMLISKINKIINDIKPDVIFSNSIKAHVLANYKKKSSKYYSLT
ncbi:hypothetical protein GCM10020331_024480 [Ectobacillus funiculus]